MKRLIGLLLITGVAGLLLITSSCKTKANSYAEDRAQIMDLQARYLFALDFFDMDAYVSTFKPDGVLDIIGQQAKGRDEIRKMLEGPDRFRSGDAGHGRGISSDRAPQHHKHRPENRRRQGDGKSLLVPLRQQ